MNAEYIQNILSSEHSYQTEFHEAVLEIYNDIINHSSIKKTEVDNFFERIIEPDRSLRFKVEWLDDRGNLNVNRGYRIQFNNALGPYKGGLRFHPSVNESIVKFLGFEQVFKNALTGLPMGGAKGGSDFNPKGKSDVEVQNFCKAFITELSKHIEEDMDVPAGDIGVGAREIGYMYGHYLKMFTRHRGILTGKNPLFGGVEGREQATGYGCVYILEKACKEHSLNIKNLSALVSGAGNVAIHAAEKLIDKGVLVKTLSDSSGVLYFSEGMTKENLVKIKELKLKKKKRLSEYKGSEATYHDGEVPWIFSADIILPCATQNEVSSSHIESLLSNGLKVISEGANKPLESGAIKMATDKGIIYLPGKAANAGGVAVSGLEITQNAKKTNTDFKTIDNSLQSIMEEIHHNCSHGLDKVNGVIPYRVGANIYSFKKIKNATEILWG